MVIGSSYIELTRRSTRLVLVVLTAIFFGLSIGTCQSHAQSQAPAPSQQVEISKGTAHLQLMEESVLSLAEKLSEIYPSTCDERETCNICTQDECRPLKGQLMCANVTNNVRCNAYYSNETCPPSIRVSMERSAVAYPRDNREAYPDPAQARTICITNKLDDHLKYLFKRNPYHSEYYTGFPDGSRRSFPGREEDDPQTHSCIAYDCRKRPWYNAAISHRNHLVILVDLREEPLDPSYTQQSDTLTFAKAYAEKLLDTVYNEDLVNVVPFSSAPQAQALQEESLRVGFNISDPQTHDELKPLKEGLDKLHPVPDDVKLTSSNLTAGLQEALRLFRTANDMATKNIVVFTNGDIAEDVGLNLTVDQVAVNLIRLFIFSMKNTDDKLRDLDALAARASGAHIRLTTSVNKLYQVRAYFNYLARMQALSKRTMPIWTPAYKDYYDIGEIITVVAQAFSKSNPEKLIGVAAIDILYEEIGDNKDDFKAALFNRLYNEGSIDADVFHSVKVYTDTSKDQGSCDFKEENVMCREVTINKKQHFLERMCCENCHAERSGDDKHTMKIAIPIIAGVFGFILFCVAVSCCWKKLAAGPKDAENSDYSGSGSAAFRTSSDTLLVISESEDVTSHSINQVSLKLCLGGPKSDLKR